MDEKQFRKNVILGILAVINLLIDIRNNSRMAVQLSSLEEVKSEITDITVQEIRDKLNSYTKAL